MFDFPLISIITFLYDFLTKFSKGIIFLILTLLVVPDSDIESFCRVITKELAVFNLSLFETSKSENKNNSNSLFKSVNLIIANEFPFALFFLE